VVVSAWRWIRFAEEVEPRGSLVWAQAGEALPFTPQRFFLIHGVPDGVVRGAHAHRELHEVLVAVAGEVTLELDDGCEQATVVLDDPALGLYLPPPVWRTQRRYMPGSMLLALASHHYDPDDYVRDHDEFRRLVGP
jgi:hypothetical protein